MWVNDPPGIVADRTPASRPPAASAKNQPILQPVVGENLSELPNSSRLPARDGYFRLENRSAAGHHSHPSASLRPDQLGRGDASAAAETPAIAVTNKAAHTPLSASHEAKSDVIGVVVSKYDTTNAVT